MQRGEFEGPYKVVHGEENPKTGDIFIEVVLAESGYLNQATPQVGYIPEVLEKWHNDRVWEGKVQNAHPSKNHPLIYEDHPRQDSSIAEKVAHYIDRSAKWGFGTYIKTKLTTLKDGINKRLSGILRITDEGAKKAWREGKYPKYNSSSVFILDRDAKTGLITNAIPIASTSVDNPANPLDVASIQNQCEGGNECVHRLAESDHTCLYCRHTVLSSFVNKFSSNSNENISESSMVNDEASKPDAPVVDAVTTINDEITSADGKPLNEQKQKESEVIDKDALIESLKKELSDTKKTLKTQTETNDSNTKEIEQIKRERLDAKIRAILNKVPMFAFENKEENKEEVVKRYMSKFGKIKENEILSDVESEFKLAHKMMTIQQKNSQKKTEVAESSALITNDGKLNVTEEDLAESGKGKSSILKFDEVFG